MKKYRLGIAWIVCVLLLIPTLNMAQTQESASAKPFPSKAVHLVIPFVAGGAIDVIGRLIAERLSVQWKQPVVIENRAGAGGSVGAQYVASAAPDGHTILFASTGLLHNAVLFPTQTIDPFRDFTPISQVLTTPVAFVVSSQSTANTMAEFVANARNKKLSYGSFGPGTTSHIYGEQLKVITKLDMTHVPYKGEAAALPDVMSANVAGAFLSVTTSANALKSGRVKVLGVTGRSAVQNLPGVPTLLSSGFEGFESVGWFGWFAPAGTPSRVVEKISTDLNNALADPELIKRAVAAGFDITGTTPAEFTSIMKSDNERWRRMIIQLGIKVD
jgi:tripartite-type tricarboxylate transporter receptor subunit TctC